MPTVPNCHLAMTIALCIRSKLNNELKDLGEDVERSKIEVLVQEGKHETKYEIDKQVNDKERVLAALEDEHVQAAISGLIRDRVNN